MSKEQIIRDFYSALNIKDYKTMNSLYHDDVTFEDPAFGKLNAIEAKKMWEMLCKGAKDLSVQCIKVEFIQDNVYKSLTVAQYTFSKTNRKVINHLHGHFLLKDDKIIKHVDYFNLWKWTSQALGFKGVLFGWTSFFRKQLQNVTRRQLKKYIENNP